MERQIEKILSGEELKKLMVGDALPEEYITEKNLNILFDYEIEQMGVNEYYDTTIIGYCADLIVNNYTDENYKKRKQETFEKIKARITADEKRKKRLLHRTTQIAAACIIGIISVQLISFTAFGTDLFGWTKDKFLALIGVETEQGDMSFEVSRVRQYKTIEEFEKAENIDIMIPMWLPGDMEIEFVMYSYEYTKKLITVNYKNNILSLSVEINSPSFDTSNAKIYEINGINFYIFEESNIIWWEYDGNFYSLTCGFDVSGYAEKIIENIK